MNGRLAGVALQLTALAVFVCMDTLLKLLTAHFAVPQLMWARFFFSLVAAAAFFRLVTGRLPWRSKAPRLQAVRSLLLAGSNLMFSSALVHLPLTDCTAIGFASPLFTVALAALWLKERVGPRRWTGVGIGFLGVLVALRPPFLTGGEPVHWAAILPLGTAAMFAVYSILTRKLAAIDDPRTTILHTGFAGAIAASLVQPFVWTPPTGLEWGMLIGLGLPRRDRAWAAGVGLRPGASQPAGADVLYPAHLGNSRRGPGLRRLARPDDTGRRRGDRPWRGAGGPARPWAGSALAHLMGPCLARPGGLARDFPVFT
ncbi:DMT family transporter [Dankookia sp. P2]|uniref:DMT family transporter n=1 Tax=Dankookia sp. P2 TaxID=3423955 RepID=UPI003D675857